MQLIVSGSADLVGSCFKGLVALKMTRSWVITSQAIVGVLMGNEESASCLCGSVIPLVVLGELSVRVMDMDSLKVSAPASLHPLPLPD